MNQPYSLSVIDGSTDSVHYVDVALDPFMVAVNPRTNLVYVTHGFDLITVIDGSTDTVKATFSIGSEAREIAFDPNGRYLYVAARNTNSLAVVDARTNTLYVLDQQAGLVRARDASSDRTIAEVRLEGTPSALALDEEPSPATCVERLLCCQLELQDEHGRRDRKPAPILLTSKR